MDRWATVWSMFSAVFSCVVCLGAAAEPSPSPVPKNRLRLTIEDQSVGMGETKVYVRIFPVKDRTSPPHMLWRNYTSKTASPHRLSMPSKTN